MRLYNDVRKVWDVLPTKENISTKIGVMFWLMIKIVYWMKIRVAFLTNFEVEFMIFEIVFGAAKWMLFVDFLNCTFIDLLGCTHDENKDYHYCIFKVIYGYIFHDCCSYIFYKFEDCASVDFDASIMEFGTII